MASRKQWTRRNQVLKALGAASPLVAGLGAGRALAGDTFNINGGEVNISGATLFRDFFAGKASTNDWNDFDNDGVKYPNVDQLAADYTPGQGSLNTWWLVQYRSVGSLNGLDEFVDWQLCRELPVSIPSEVGFLNRYTWANVGVIQTPLEYRCGPTGTPYCPSSIDLASIDVPTKWATVGDQGNPAWNLKPGASGYGLNPDRSNNLCTIEGEPNELVSLERNCAPFAGGRSLNTNTDNPDRNTVYDTTVALSPVAYIVNRGTGLQNVRVTDMQYLFVAGRMPNGENLRAATRDAGSGTRNASMNPSGIDPSWGVGDHKGIFINTTTPTNVGPCTQVNNCGSSSIIENAVQQHRLAVGYTGLAGPSRAANDAFVGRYEIVNTMNDHVGGTLFVRPTINTVIDNADPNTGYRIGASQTLVSRGDPFETDSNADWYVQNRAAADYIKNIMFSIAQFDPNLPGNPDNYSPAQFLATRFFLEQGCDRAPTLNDPTVWVQSPDFNQGLQNFIRANITLIDSVNRDTPAYGSINKAGLVPVRNAGSYSDGGTAAYLYNVNGVPQTPIAGGKKLAERNRIQGDFNFDGTRNLNDAAGLMLALTDPLNYESGSVWPGDPGDQSANVVIVNVIGDFNGDGNFDAGDARYFADGLAIDTGSQKLDRKKGFTQIDQQWASLTGDTNFFDTVLASGKPYSAGDSRGDVAGSGEPSKGADPAGFDGIVDGADISYVYANFGIWSDLNDAAAIDLSCDMNGDLKVDQADVDEIINTILCTVAGDANLSGICDAADLAICQANQGLAGGWSQGDFNGDGIVNAADLAICQANQGQEGDCFSTALTLTYNGPVCPGPVSVTAANATPSGNVALIFAANQGSFVIPSGNPCAGTTLGLGSSSIQLIQTKRAASNGSVTFSGPANASACNRFLQVVDLSSCETSNVARISP